MAWTAKNQYMKRPPNGETIRTWRDGPTTRFVGRRRQSDESTIGQVHAFGLPLPPDDHKYQSGHVVPENESLIDRIAV
jgi:hypothetical protein